MLNSVFIPKLKDLQKLKDPYEEGKNDSIYNDYILNEMLNYQNDYDAEREEGYASFVKNHYHYYDVTMNFESSKKEGIFKTSSSNMIDLENF